MAFTKINKEDNSKIDGVEAILLYGYGGKDLEKIKLLCRMMGIKEIIVVKNNTLDEKVGDLLNKTNGESDTNEPIQNKAIVLNGLNGQKLHAFLNNFKKTGIRRPLIATVTPVSIEWTFRELINELERERQAIEKNTQVEHEND